MVKKQKERSGMMNKNGLYDAAALWGFFFKEIGFGRQRRFPCNVFSGVNKFQEFHKQVFCSGMDNPLPELFLR